MPTASPIALENRLSKIHFKELGAICDVTMGGECRMAGVAVGRCHINFAGATPTFGPLVIAGHTSNTAD